MFKKIIRVSNKSSWEDLAKAQELIGLQNEIRKHIITCQSYHFTQEAINRQLLFMYGKDYKKVLNTEIVMED